MTVPITEDSSYEYHPSGAEHAADLWRQPDSDAYLRVNRLAYDALAEEYRKRANIDRAKDLPLVEPFIGYLKRNFGTRSRVLDIGPGNGMNLSMLHESGLSVVGVDISAQMLRVAHANCPSAMLCLGDFLTFPFAAAGFSGVFAKASLHCFPKPDALKAFRKVHKVLAPGGMFYVSTTAESEPSEGFDSKDDYPGKLLRFRKRWTAEELAIAIVESGFAIYKDGYDDENDWNKRWYNIWAVKPDQIN